MASGESIIAEKDAGPLQTAVATTALTRKFGEMTAVDRISLTIEQGEIFGLIGPNGAGKSTLIKMLTTMLPPTSGTAVVAGYDIGAKPAEVRRHIGYVPQLLSADGSLSGYENLLLSARKKSRTQTQAAYSLCAVTCTCTSDWTGTTDRTRPAAAPF